MATSKRIGIKTITLVMIFAVSFGLYYVCCKRTGTYYNSDHTFSIIAGKGIMSGNIFLDQWNGSRNSIYLLSLLYGIIGSVFGYSAELLWIVPSFLWAGFITLISWIIFHFYSEKPYVCIARICFVFVLCYSSSYFQYGLKILQGVHFDLTLFGVLYMWVISREIESCQTHTFSLIAASCLVFLALLSDGLTQIYVVLPILAGLSFNLLFLPAQKIKKTYLIKHLVLCAALFICSKVIFNLLQNSGRVIRVPAFNSISVRDWSELFSAIAFWIKSSMNLFGCDIFGQQIGTGSVILIIRFFVFCLMLFGIGLSLKKLAGNIFNHFLLFCIAAVSLISIFTRETDYMLGDANAVARLMYGFYFSIVLLAAQIDWNRMVSLIQLRINRKIYLGMGMAAMFLMMLFNLSILRTKDNRASAIYDRFDRIADVLVEKGLTRGYGTYWLSSSVTVASGFRADVRPVVGTDLSLCFWLSDFNVDDWEYADFVLVDGSMWGGVSEDSIIECIGIPAERIQVDGTTILVWDKNIMPYVNYSAYRGETRNGWWNPEDVQTEKVVETTNEHFYSSFEAGENGYYTSHGEGFVIYGPYRAMRSGVYDITFEYDYAGALEEGTVLGVVDVFSAGGGVESEMVQAIAGENSVTIKNIRVRANYSDFETRFYAYVDGVTMQRLVIRYLDMSNIY